MGTEQVVEVGKQTSQGATERRKTGLVLSGGGARGAYEVGAVKALREHGISFDLSIGTSIGAINSAFIAQGDFDSWETMWRGLKSADVFHPLSIVRMTHLVNGAANGLLDNSPLEQLLRKYLDLPKIKAATTKVGWCMTDLCSQDTTLITAEDIKDMDMLIDTLMATSAVPLAFPPRSIAGQGMYIDGGLVRNTPMKFALENGVREIYAVLLNGHCPDKPPVHFMDCFDQVMDIMLDSSARNAIAFAHFYNSVLAKGDPNDVLRLHVLRPRKAMHLNILHFDPAITEDLMQQGYEDTKYHLETLDCADCEATPENMGKHWY